MYDYLSDKDRKAIETDLFGADPEKVVTFEDQVVLDQVASDKEQRPIFKSGTFIHIRMLDSETGKNMSYPVRDHHKQEYPAEWQAYLDRKNRPAGIPTDILLNFGVAPQDVATLKSNGAFTLADMDKCPGFEAAKQIAATLLRARDGGNSERIEDRRGAGSDSRPPEGAANGERGSHQEVQPHEHESGRDQGAKEPIRIGPQGTEFTLPNYQAWG